MDMTGDGMNPYDLSEGQSLDDIVFQNDTANRRQSMPVYARQQHLQMGSPDTRRLSMLNFSGPNGGSMADFQFDLSNPSAIDNMMPSNTSFPTSSADMQSDGMPAPDLGANPHFSAAKSPYSNMGTSGSTYASPIHPNASLDLDMNSYPNNMSMPVSMDSSLNNMMQSDMAMFPNNQFSQPIMESPINHGSDFVGPLPGPQRDNLPPSSHFRSPSVSNTPETISGKSGKPSRTNSQDQVSVRSGSRPENEHRNSSHDSSLPTQLSLASLNNQRPIALDPRQSLSGEAYEQVKNMTSNWNVPSGGFPSTMHSNPHQKTQFKDAYSSSGFDMLGVLMRVATRPNPQIDIGSVDLSCAFVVCDADMDDIPIVYCSENFERLTGYTRHMILGRNCRFLQSPDGKVESGIKRKYVDDDSVLYLKNTISAVTEAQISLINYRRGGQPFMNLLTMIPISWEPGGKVKFFVGFQVDLVEQPGAMTNQNKGKSPFLFPSTRLTSDRRILQGQLSAWHVYTKLRLQ
jgi:PAS domain-containing protein